MISPLIHQVPLPFPTPEHRERCTNGISKAIYPRFPTHDAQSVRQRVLVFASLSSCENPCRHDAQISYAHDYHQQPHNLQRKKNDGRKEHDTNLAHPFQSLVMCSGRGRGFGLPP